MPRPTVSNSDYATQSVLERIRLPRPVIVIVLLLALLLLLRLPSAFFPRQLDPDESQGLANAMKFVVDPRPWIAVDGGSWGPLNCYLITLFLLLGFKAGYVLAHLLATGLLCLQVLIGYLTLRKIGSDKIASFGAVLMVAFYGLASHPNYLAYSGELLPTLLLAAGFYCFVVWLDEAPKTPRVRLVLLCLAGVALGATPWCKLQAGPIGLAIGVIMLAAILWQKHDKSSFTSFRVIELLAISCGAVLTSAVMFTIMAESGALNDFWHSYITGNITHAGSLSISRGIIYAFVMLLLAPVRQLVLVGICVLVYCSLYSTSLIFSDKQKWALTGIAIYAGASLFAISRVQYLFFHHGMFLVPPLTYMAVGLLCGRAAKLPERPPGKLSRGVMLLLIAGAAALYSWYAFQYGEMVQTIRKWHDGQAAFSMKRRPAVELKNNFNYLAQWDSYVRVAYAVGELRTCSSVHSLEIWGWAPGVYVATNIPPATRDAVVSPQWSVADNYFRPRFLADLRQHTPDLFVDAVAPDLMQAGWNQDEGYESYPELRKFIDENYFLADELTLVEGAKPVRLFLRQSLKSPSCESRRSLGLPSP